MSAFTFAMLRFTSVQKFNLFLDSVMKMESKNNKLAQVLALKTIQSAKAIIIVAGNGLSADTGISIGDPKLENKYVDLTYRLRNPDTLEFATADSYSRHYNYSSDLYSIPEYLNKIKNAPDNSAQQQHLKEHLRKIILLRTPDPSFLTLKAMIKEPPYGYFIVTGNIDGYFQKTGFDENAILELNGSLNQLNVQERQLTDFAYYINKLKELDIVPVILEIGITESDLKLKMYAKELERKIKCTHIKICDLSV